MGEAGEARRFSEEGNEDEKEVSEAYEVKDVGIAKSEGSSPGRTLRRTSGRICRRMEGSKRWTTAVMACVWKSVSSPLGFGQGKGGDVAASVGEPAWAVSMACRLYGGGVDGGLETAQVGFWSAWLGHEG